MKGQHIRGLNGIKGLAILMVISYHLFPSVTSGGFLWVNSFFVLGGFFLARSMEKILKNSPTTWVATFGLYLNYVGLSPSLGSAGAEL